jgi:hypothetical protein
MSFPDITPPQNERTATMSSPDTTPPQNERTSTMSARKIPFEILFMFADKMRDSQGKLRYGDFNAFHQVSIVPHVSMQLSANRSSR